jgi:type IV pilus assembly protein PilE
MITVAVIAILAAIAMPVYTSYVPRSKITEATGSLSDMRNRLEQYFLDNRTYPANCIPAAAGPAPAGSIYLPGGTQYFTVTCAFPSATTYTITATGIATKGMGSFAYTINEANTRGTTSMPSGWSGAGSNCWVTKKDGSC